MYDIIYFFENDLQQKVTMGVYNTCVSVSSIILRRKYIILIFLNNIYFIKFTKIHILNLIFYDCSVNGYIMCVHMDLYG